MQVENNIRLGGRTQESVVDGPGLRYVIWSQGCKHHCPGCHSEFTWDFEGGELVDMDIILAEIAANPLLKGVTFSGGDPFEQADKFAYLAKKIKARKLDVWCYSGYTFEQLRSANEEQPAWGELLANIDILVDGPFVMADRDLHLAFKGSRNQRIIDVPKTLETGIVQLVPLDVEINGNKQRGS